MKLAIKTEFLAALFIPGEERYWRIFPGVLHRKNLIVPRSLASFASR